jgi:S-DNA-T family DNA segregation ATPase FtsK/SpoIIIE
LLGKGHLAAKLEGAPEIIFGQVPFVNSDFLAQVVEGLREGSVG